MKTIFVCIFVTMVLSTTSHSCGKIPQSDSNTSKTTLPQGEGCSDGSPMEEDNSNGFTIKL